MFQPQTQQSSHWHYQSISIGLVLRIIVKPLNFEPLDLFGTKLNNKVGPTLSLSDDNELFVTYYPLIGGDDILDKVTDALKTVLEKEISVVTASK